MRLFIAINFNTETRSRLIALRDELRARSEQGKFSTQENLHLTLAFLGECDAKQTTSVKAAMDAVGFGLLPVNIERVGRFKRDGGDIWWAGISESKTLLDLQRSLTNELIASGFTLEKRKYSPHITLGREVVTDASPQILEGFEETISKIELMKSERICGKLIYTPIYEKRSEIP